MADSSFIATIYTKVTKVFVDNVDTYAGKIAGQAKPVIMAAFLLYMLYIVYRMYSKKDALWEEFTNKIILFAIVGAFAAVGEHYSNVIGFVLNSAMKLRLHYLVMLLVLYLLLIMCITHFKRE